MRQVVVALTLGVVIVVTSATAFGPGSNSRAAASEPESPATSTTPYDYSAIGEVIRANNGRVPANGRELVRALTRLGGFAQLPVPFSAVNSASGLTTPRVILAPHPNLPDLEDDIDAVLTKSKLDDPVRLAQVLSMLNRSRVLPSPSPLSLAAANDSDLTGRLFFAVNLTRTPDGVIRTETIEFISWNCRHKRFDFGVIECKAEGGELHLLDGVRCFACHKNQGPILGEGPWSNTMHNDVVRQAALQALARLPGQDSLRDLIKSPEFARLAFRRGVTGLPLVTPALRRATTHDGLSLVQADPEACDLACRIGSQRLRDRHILTHMLRYPDGRKTYSVLLAAILTEGDLVANSLKTTRLVDATFNRNYVQFAERVAAVNRNHSDMLIDFNPSGSMGQLRSVVTNQPASWGGGSTQRLDVILTWSGDVDLVTRYDARRAKGEIGLPSQRQPSNPRAFIKPSGSLLARASTVVTPVMLARALGLTEGDRRFFYEQIDRLIGQVTGDPPDRAALIRDLVNAPAITDPLCEGQLPDREEFKEQFMTALEQVARARQVDLPQRPERSSYASGPVPPAAGPAVPEPLRVPTTACLRCHDVAGVGRPAFNPIPKLAFDPLDEKARRTWADHTPPAARRPVLQRLYKRVFTDADMPPEDSPEHEHFRVKNPAGLDGLRKWLDTELGQLQ